MVHTLKKFSMILEPESKIAPNITKAGEVRIGKREHASMEKKKLTSEVSREWHSHITEFQAAP